MRRSLLFLVLLLCLPVALSAPIAFALSGSTAGTSDAGQDTCRSVTAGLSGEDPVRVRCDVTQHPDPRVGDSASVVVFVGAICPEEQGDEACAIKHTQPVARTGAEGRNDLLTPVPGGTLAHPQVCIEGHPCVVDEEVNHQTVYLFNPTGPNDWDNEASVWNPSGSQTHLNPPQLCASTEGNCDNASGLPLPGHVGVENTNAGGWVDPS